MGMEGMNFGPKRVEDPKLAEKIAHEAKAEVESKTLGIFKKSEKAQTEAMQKAEEKVLSEETFYSDIDQANADYNANQERDRRSHQALEQLEKEQVIGRAKSDLELAAYKLQSGVSSLADQVNKIHPETVFSEDTKGKMIRGVHKKFEGQIPSNIEIADLKSKLIKVLEESGMSNRDAVRQADEIEDRGKQRARKERSTERFNAQADFNERWRRSS